MPASRPRHALLCLTPPYCLVMPHTAFLCLTPSEGPLLLFCRRAPSSAYVLVGRLEPVALARQALSTVEISNATASIGATCTAGIADSSSVVSGSPSALPTWCTTQANHVVFRLLDAAALMPPYSEVLATVLGGREVEPKRPEHYLM